MHARNDSREITAAARAAFLSRFVDEVDPDRELPEPERLRRAAMARKAHFSRLAYHSAIARAKKAPAPVKADAQEVRRAGTPSTPTS